MQIQSAPPALPYSDNMRKAFADAFEELREKAWTIEPSNNVKSSPEQPKSWLTDPYALMETIGMGYRNAPSVLTFDTLRMTSERNTVIAAIILTRVNQVAAFCRPQENKYSVGFKIRLRGSAHMNRRPTSSEKDKSGFIEHYLLNTGLVFNLGRDGFEQAVRKLVRDSLTYDQLTFEKIRTYGGRPHSFIVVPADTVRIVAPRIPKGTPPAKAELKKQLKYVQVINGEIVTEYTHDEMAFGVRNPRSYMKVFGYGLPEIEILMTTVTSHLWAEEWNRRQFSQGSTIKGVVNFQGNIPPQQFEAFKRQWYAQVSGVSNAWKTPVVNTDGMTFIPLQGNNVEMGYQMWMEYLIKIASAIYQIDPAEINFDLRGGSQQQPLFMSSNEAQQKVSKDRGLQPLLRFVEDTINRHVVWQIDPRFELAFVGLDAKTEDQAMQLRQQQVSNIFTLNEVRAMEDLPPLPHGDMPLNPVYAGAKQQAQMMEQQQQMGGAGGAPGGPPGAGGMPGAPPGAPLGGAPPDQEAEPGGQPQPAQPYAGRFDGKKPGKEEKHGADNLRRFHDEDDNTSSPERGDHETSSSDSDDSSEDKRYVHLHDWDSTVHASVKDNDLAKSTVFYDVIE